MEGSRLGLKEYWEEAYEKELQNLDEFGDEGEIWSGLLHPWISCRCGWVQEEF